MAKPTRPAQSKAPACIGYAEGIAGRLWRAGHHTIITRPACNAVALRAGHPSFVPIPAKAA